MQVYCLSDSSDSVTSLSCSLVLPGMGGWGCLPAAQHLTCHRSVRIQACVDINKRPSAHGAVDISHIKTTLTEYSCLLVCDLKCKNKIT